MNVHEAIKSKQDTKFYAVKRINIKWDTLKFMNASPVVAEYKVVDFGNNHKILRYYKGDKGTGSFPKELSIFKDIGEVIFFKTREEAEVFKKIEIYKLDEIVNNHINLLKQKLIPRANKLKTKVDLEKLVTEYPEIVLAVIS